MTATEDSEFAGISDGIAVPFLGDSFANARKIDFINGRSGQVEEFKVRRGMKGQVTVVALAEKLGITRSNLHKRIRREGIKTNKEPCITGGGVQTLTTVPLPYAKRLIQHYEEAKVNATCGAFDLSRANATRGTA
jgi:hypothetical protein